MMATTVDIFAAWQPWQVALAETVALEMLSHDIGPEQMRDLARQYMREHAASEAQKAAAQPGAAPYRRPPANRFRPSRRLPRPEWQTEEERGLFHLRNACPKCGATVEGKRMCPHISPRIRSQLACTNDACDWAAVSEHGWDYLARNGLDGNVEVQ